MAFLDIFGWEFKPTKEQQIVPAGYVAPSNDDVTFYNW